MEPMNKLGIAMGIAGAAVALAILLVAFTELTTNKIKDKLIASANTVHTNRLLAIGDLELHETITIEQGKHFTAITKVPGGLLYRTGRGCAFVPIKEEEK